MHVVCAVCGLYGLCDYASKCLCLPVRVGCGGVLESLAPQHWQTRIFRKSWIGCREPTQVENRPAIAADDVRVHAVAAQAWCRLPITAGIIHHAE
jgi:hypothetical protein